MTVPIQTENQPVIHFWQHPEKREQIYRTLYEKPTVFRKVSLWIADYGLKGCEVEDVLQDAMIALDEQLSGNIFRGDCSIETFFLGICHNIIRAGARRVQRITFKDDLTDADMNTPEGVSDILILQEEMSAESEQAENLMERLRDLTDICREALQRYYFEALNMKQMALLNLQGTKNNWKPLPNRLKKRYTVAAKTCGICCANDTHYSF
jgi:RNA polymerase sigma factor (sigma-70 family)